MINVTTILPSEDQLRTVIMHTASVVWDNKLVEKDIDLWLNNFNGSFLDKDEERLLALWFLSHFTYYNKKEISHLCKVLYKDLLHYIALKYHSGTITISDSIDRFLKKSNIISPGKTSDSGGFIAYFFRHENALPMDLFNFSVHNIASSIDYLLVIDDVTLTASEKGQAYNFFIEAKRLYPTKKFILLTLVANDDAIAFLKNRFNVEVITAIKLDQRDKCFNNKSDLFSPFPQLIPLAKQFAEHYGRKITPYDPTNWLGYQDGQYTFGFYYNTPDNTLPLFWGQQNGWTPILKRYHKKYNSTNFAVDERFL